MKFVFALILLVVSAATVVAQNVVINLIAPMEAAAPGGMVRVDLVILNPTSVEVIFETPLTLDAHLSSEKQGWPVVLRGQAGGGAQIAARGFSYRSFEFTVPPDAHGRLVLELDRPQPARATVMVETRPKTTAEPRTVSAPLSNIFPSQPAASAVQRSFAGRFTAHEPVYFIYGPDAPAAKFQFSFKYRLLGDNGRLGDKVPVLRGLYLGFTQRSLWDINADSSPFFDTSYMPEVMYESQSYLDLGKTGGFQILGFQAGVRHESNGRDGVNSRSLNIVYFRPAVAFGRLDSWNLVLAPRFFTYVSDLGDNRDIANYRGYSELAAIFGKNDSVALSVSGRLGRAGHKGSVQADLTIPVRFDKLFDFATYVMIQYWNGYGESLRNYNQQSSTVRAGFSLVR